ncbi:unnamed protein product [Blepharisma stoltei]|uniref:Uncharacterized protein n=1 Tax=Blepharisma stoltei TaxID=1481888 RepID=A0AAU9K9B8_9CILI|nr:unnamed protein product [Blepharisma stoltei]
MPEKKIIVEFLGRPWHISLIMCKLTRERNKNPPFKYTRLECYRNIRNEKFWDSIAKSLSSLENQQNNPQFMDIDK